MSEDWNTGRFAGQGGWLEMHPPDWVVRVGSAPGPNARQTYLVAKLQTADITGAGADQVDQIGPDFAPSSVTRYLQVRAVQVNTDSRFTYDASVRELRSIDQTDHVDIVASVAPTGSAQGRFKGSWLVSWRELDRADQVWINDRLPDGARPFADRESWDWTADNPGPFIGDQCHRSALIDNDWHQHAFDSASQRLVVGARDVLFAMIYLDPDYPPDQIMLQWHAGDWEHRAYWGENNLDWGTDGTASRQRMGPLPRSAEWVRLEVPAAWVGLAGASLDGMAFTLWGGRAIWDYAGVRVAQLRVSADPTAIVIGEDEPVVTVTAVDAATGTAVDGTVSLSGQVIGPTQAPVPLPPRPFGARLLTVHCDGYPDANVTVTILRPKIGLGGHMPA